MLSTTDSQKSNAEKKSNKSIFSVPIEKKKKEHKKLNQKQKNDKLSLIYLGIAGVLLTVYSVLFLYPQLVAYIGYEKKINSVEKQVKSYSITLADLGKKKDLHKASYDDEFKEEQTIIYKVFPKNTDKLAIIRLLENFATHLNSTYPPFKFTSISFEKSKKENGYTVLPLRTSIHSSQKNFERFLGLINLAGNIDPAISNHVRLMEITNISLRYRGPDKSGKDQGVDFNVQLNAYSR